MENIQILQECLNRANNDVLIFLNNIILEDFPVHIRKFVSIVGVETTLQLSLVTSRIYIPKKITECFKVGNNHKAQIILHSLDKNTIVVLSKTYQGANVEIPTLNFLKTATIDRVNRVNCLQLLHTGMSVMEVSRELKLPNRFVRKCQQWG